MFEKVFETRYGDIHYWVSKVAEQPSPQLIFLPGLTADHRLFDKQIEYFEGKYPLFVWDAPGHAASYPFELKFNLEDKADWLSEILDREGFDEPVIIGQSMGGYLGQMYEQFYPDKLRGFISIDSSPLKKEYYTKAELWLLTRMEPVYLRYPWKALLSSGTRGVAETEYGRSLMREIMMTYDGDKKRYAALAGHGYRILAGAVKADLPYDIKCPVLLICGKKDRAGSTKRYNKAWNKKGGLPIEWIEGAGHNSNTDKPEEVNQIIEKFVGGLNDLSHEEKKRQLYLRQKRLLDTFLDKGAISKEQYDKSLHDLTEKMGFGMDISSIDYLGFRRVIDRGTAEIIEEDKKVLFLYDKVSAVYMLACDDPELAKAVLDRHEDRKVDLLMTTSKEAAEYIREKNGLENFMECYQYAYLGEIPEEDPDLTFRAAGMDDLPVIMQVYDQITEEEMTKDIARESVLMAYEGDDLVGFIGEHLEGSQGMLYVYPEYRRKGYATALENAIFAKTMKEGRIPFGQVVSDNKASIELQKKNGLTQADKKIYWTW